MTAYCGEIKDGHLVSLPGLLEVDRPVLTALEDRPAATVGVEVTPGIHTQLLIGI